MRIPDRWSRGLGGYFGARLLQQRRDVTFLVRARRAAQLAKTGLVVRSALGDANIPVPPLVLSENIAGPYDLIVVGCKAYDLAPTMESFAKAVGPETAILPYLNGMKHFDSLSERFGARYVLGGLAMISATLDDEGIVLHLNETHTLVYGELDGAQSPRMAAIAAEFAGVQLDARGTNTIVQELWEKWAFISTLGGVTSLMRAVIGDIERAGAANCIAGPARRVRGDCRVAGLCAAARGTRARPRAVHGARLDAHRFDDEGHRARVTNRGRAHHRGSARARGTRGSGYAVVADRVCAPRSV